MFQHIAQYAADMGIGGGVKHLLALALRLDDTRRPQEPQMVADKRAAQVQCSRDFAHRDGRRQAGQHDAQPGRIAQQVEQIGQLRDGGVGFGIDSHS